MATPFRKDLKIACWNCRGLSSSIPFLRSLLDRNDIVLISEHWLHNNRLQQLDEIHNDFNVCGRSSRLSSEETYGIRRGQGGVAIFWRKDLKGVSTIETIRHDRICGIRLECAEGSVLVVLSVYMPAGGSSDNIEVALDELGAIIDDLEVGAIPIVGGDFNGNMGTTGGPRGRGGPTKAGSAVLSFMTDQNLMAVNLVEKATGPVNTYEGHNGSSLIDYIMIPCFMESKIRACHTGRDEASNTSDHLPIESTINVGTLPRSIEVKMGPKRLKWEKCDTAFLVENYQIPIQHDLMAVQELLGDPNISNESVDLCIDAIINTLHDTARVIPTAKFVKHLKPYWNEELNLLKKDKMKWFKKWKAEGRTKQLNDPVRIRMLESKKLFSKCLR